MGFSAFDYCWGFAIGISVGLLVSHCKEKKTPLDETANRLELTCQEMGEIGKEVKIDRTPYLLKCDVQGKPVLTLHYENLPEENCSQCYQNDRGMP